MSSRSAALWSVGIGLLAVAATAASQSSAVEATIPLEGAVPAAESVETVLRATYSLPADRGNALSSFLTANAAPGIDVRVERSNGDSSVVSLTVIALEAEQKALGAFIAKCVNKEPGTVRGNNGPTPFGAPTPDPDFGGPTPDGFGTAPNDGFTPVPPRGT